MTRIPRRLVKAVLDKRDFASLVTGLEIIVIGRDADGMQEVRIVLQDIGFEAMRDAVETAVKASNLQLGKRGGSEASRREK